MPKLLKIVISLQLSVFSLFLFASTTFSVGDLTVQSPCDPADDQCAEGLTCQQATIDQGAIQSGDYACFSAPSSTNSEAAPNAASTATPTTTSTTDTQPTNIVNDSGTPVDSKNYKAPQNANYSLENLEHGLLCELVGMSPAGQCIGQQKTADGKVKVSLYDKIPGGGAIGGLTSITVATLTSPPTSSQQYLASIGENFGVKPAYAQSVGGSGAGIIKPVMALWQVTRNLAYLAFIIVFIAVGFMIMFRAKINPQTVISAQAALPGLVVGLILVTFSYFIASLLIDISFVGMQLVSQLFIQSGAPNMFGNKPDEIQKLAQNSNVFELFTSSFRFKDNFTDATGGVGRTLFGVVGNLIDGLVGGPLGAAAKVVVGVGFTIPGLLVSAVIGLLITLVLMIALVIQFFRLMIKLIAAYVALLVSTVTGPVIILYASIPGKGGAMGMWWKSLIGNALIFPAVFAAFLFAGMILGTNPNDWQASPPLFGGLSTELLRLIIAYGVILGTPAIPDMVKKAMGVPDFGAIPQTAVGGFASAFVPINRATQPVKSAHDSYAKEQANRRATAVATGGTLSIPLPGGRRIPSGALTQIVKRWPF